MMNDIHTKLDVKIFIDTFYEKAKIDGLLGPVFASAIPDGNWQPHMEQIYGFWNTVLLGTAEYIGNPFSKHRYLPIEKRHFDQWVELFCDAVDEHYQGPKAEEAKSRANKMGQMFLGKLEYLKNNPNTKNIL